MSNDSEIANVIGDRIHPGLNKRGESSVQECIRNTEFGKGSHEHREFDGGQKFVHSRFNLLNQRRWDILGGRGWQLAYSGNKHCNLNG